MGIGKIREKWAKIPIGSEHKKYENEAYKIRLEEYEFNQSHYASRSCDIKFYCHDIDISELINTYNDPVPEPEITYDEFWLNNLPKN